MTSPKKTSFSQLLSKSLFYWIPMFLVLLPSTHWEISPKSRVLVWCQFSKLLQHKLKCSFCTVLNSLFKPQTWKVRRICELNGFSEIREKCIGDYCINSKSNVYFCFFTFNISVRNKKRKFLCSESTYKKYSRRGEEKLLLLKPNAVSQICGMFISTGIFHKYARKLQVAVNCSNS